MEMRAALQTFLNDVRYAWRGLRRRPSFALIAVATLALGIGVNTAVFSVFHAVLMRPLPYQHPEQLVRIWAEFQSRGIARAPLSGGMLREIEQRNRAFSGVAGVWVVGPSTFTGDTPEQVKSARVTVNFFDLLGIRPARGRSFTKEDHGGPATLLSYGFFRRRFGADNGVIGKRLPIQVTGITSAGPTGSNTLAGVLPADFQLQFAPDANVPTDVDVFDTFDFDIYEGMTQYYLRLVARLKPGVSVAEAQRDLDRVAAEIRSAYSEFGSEHLQLKLAGLQDDAFGDVRPALTALFAGAGFVLLICCVNVTSLLLSRAGDRRKEIALRLALGASRVRILRQLLVEGAVLSWLGVSVGIAVGWAVFRGLLAIRPERLARIEDAGPRWPVLALAAAVALAATLLFGISPALQSFRMDHMEALRKSGRGWVGRSHARVGGALVVVEIILGFVLVTGAALTARTLSKIEAVHPGFEPKQLLTFQLAVASAFRSPRELADWEAELAALPGVKRAGAATHLPLDNDLPNWYGPYHPDGMTEVQAAGLAADLRPVTPGFLPAMGAHLIEGRYFDQRDREDGQQVVIVDDSLARLSWPGQSAIGKRLEAEHVTSRGFENVSCVVVGVVGHLHNHSLTQEVRPEIYMPFEQSRRSPMTFVLRTSVPPLSLVPLIREALRRRSPNAAIAKVRPMAEYMEREIAPAKFTAVLAAIFGALALLLAATGIYGVMNYQVSRRLPEMGIRMAVGASARDVLGLVLWEGLTLAAAGVVLGAASAFAAARWLGALMYGVSTHDPLSYVLALALLPAAALLGCWRPAWRAAGSNPAEIIREE
jgi:putative ABC transport system permease protein